MHKLSFLLALATALVVLPACDAFGGGDPTIGGTYSGIDPAQGQRVSMIIPADTESDPDATFTLTYTETGFPDAIETATYAYPTLTLTGDVSLRCTVDETGDSLDCRPTAGQDFGNFVFTR